jgi:hypothetical protein
MACSRCSVDVYSFRVTVLACLQLLAFCDTSCTAYPLDYAYSLDAVSLVTYYHADTIPTLLFCD